MSMAKEIDLCEGKILPKILLFSFPIIVGNLFQQAYNLVDTLIVGRVLGPESLASVGSAYALMTFINSLLIGLSMGSGALFSYNWGKGEKTELRKDIYNSFILFSILSILLTTNPLRTWSSSLRISSRIITGQVRLRRRIISASESFSESAALRS